jgi:ribosomal-protein-alanine N-acetyltransferase
MSRESGIRRWIPDQVYSDESHTAEVLEYLMAQYDGRRSPAEAPIVFGVCDRETGELVGHVGLSQLEDQVEIGYAIEETCQGRGYATEAVSAMTRWGHDTFGLPTILGVVARENLGSCRVLEKSGFVLAKEEADTLHGRKGLIRTYIMEY